MSKKSKTIHASKFNCQHVLKFIDRCNSCAKRSKCKYRGYLLTILQGKKQIDYRKKLVV